MGGVNHSIQGAANFKATLGLADSVVADVDSWGPSTTLWEPHRTRPPALSITLINTKTEQGMYKLIKQGIFSYTYARLFFDVQFGT